MLNLCNIFSCNSFSPKSRQEKEELHVVRKRVVNTTMLSAIGPTKKRKLENALEGSSTPKAVSIETFLLLSCK